MIIFSVVLFSKDIPYAGYPERLVSPAVINWYSGMINGSIAYVLAYI
jgi:hypothetical protein